ncbi:threonine dehydrogenase-like Zn-dependent dehydrogenase [Novosphingobium hassiacum]|uniref:Threonine dehydrogenase-like Zn-dependent dehydrogenase n=1 Tax=Novosphingobium hassiacum TaxID=173676 RepID=A0A7W5ZVC8_9SPHN|nr:zinc-dependent alcohol dehydrogenase [Novosphingobium hassiacum]MBB3859139.1 threonine dehydrogenase-like Zn-dependent dehydrogenase [Novosphingobium hassiacum]
MKAIAWHGKHDVRYDTVDDPEILNPRDAIIRVTSTAICGSDLHLYDGYIPTMQKGDILGHEFMGEVVETGPKSTLKTGQRVVVPFTISCGKCYHCSKHQYSGCENGNPADNQDISREGMGLPMGAAFGYSHMTGGYSGGQAEYVRVPFSDFGPLVIPDDSIEDDKVLFLTDILPTGWMAAENAQIEPGDTVAVWGCGPVGLFAVQSAFLMGAERVIAIDHFPRRLEMARQFGAETVNFEESKVAEALWDMTGGIGPDATIDCVGLEAHGAFADNVIDQIKVSTFLGTDRAHVIRQAIMATRKGGRVSMPGVYAGFVDKFPLGAFMEKGLTLKTGQTHVQQYLRPLYTAIAEGKIDSTFLISHRMALEEGPTGYQKFHDEQDKYTKIVLKPGTSAKAA